jgi:hypothetical protein
MEVGPHVAEEKEVRTQPRNEPVAESASILGNYFWEENGLGPRMTEHANSGARGIQILGCGRPPLPWSQPPRHWNPETGPINLAPSGGEI